MSVNFRVAAFPFCLQNKFVTMEDCLYITCTKHWSSSPTYFVDGFLFLKFVLQNKKEAICVYMVIPHQFLEVEVTATQRFHPFLLGFLRLS